jgi:hypothetical protein
VCIFGTKGSCVYQHFDSCARTQQFLMILWPLAQINCRVTVCTSPNTWSTLAQCRDNPCEILAFGIRGAVLAGLTTK